MTSEELETFKKYFNLSKSCISFSYFSSMAFYLDSVLSCTRVLMRAVSGWVMRHFIGAVLVSLPGVVVLSHISCDMHLSIQVEFSFRIFFFCQSLLK